MAYQRLQNQELMRDEDEDCRLLLIGKTGSGKSATGNIIFNDRVFESLNSSSSVTRVCQTHTGEVDNRRVTVTDTPDFRFSTHTDFDSDSELKRALRSPGAHVILLILPLSTFTEHEKDFIDWFEQKFGVEALRFTLVLFTHADQTHMTLGEMISANLQLSAFISRCGDQRYHEFNVKDPANRRQVTELMEKIHRLVTENRNSCYTLEMMQETERRAKEKKREEEERRERERQMMLDRVRRETEERVRREYEQEKLDKAGKREKDEEWEMLEPEPSSAECDAEQSNLSETSWNNHYYIYMAVGAVGAAGGAVVGGAVGAVVGGAVAVGAVGVAVGAVGAAVGGAVGGVSDAGDGVIADRAKCGTGSDTESPSGLNKTEEAQSNKLS